MAGQLSMFLCLIMVMPASTNDYVNDWGQEFDFNCPYGMAIDSISSIYNKEYGDRRWNFGCKEVGDSERCYKSGWINYLNKDGKYFCEGYDDVVTGIIADRHEDTKKDRQFAIHCCTFRNLKISKIISEECEFVNIIDEFGKDVIYKVPADFFITEIEFSYEEKSNYYDRIWIVCICKIETQPEENENDDESRIE